MERLNYHVLDEQGYTGYLLREGPERVLQFGEGNFLRAFADYFIDIANEKTDFNGKVCVVQPIRTGLSDAINEQEGLCTIYLRGYENGEKVSKKRIISSISRAIDSYKEYQALLDCARNPDLRYIISNTTEAGITFDESNRYDDVPPENFPAKLARILHERYQIMGAVAGKGFVILPCELIDHNGDELKRCVMEYIKLWKLEDDFLSWVENENVFCSTMVDRIVTGYPAAEAEALGKENGYEDKLLDAGEVFAIWVIEGPEWLREELPFEKAGLPVVVCNDCSPFKKRKVRILNGVQSGMVLVSYLAGYDIARYCLDDPVIKRFMKSMVYDEIIPALDLPEEAKLAFAKESFERLENPFIDHRLLAISLNTTAKWRVRDLPSVKSYYAMFGRLPVNLTFSFAAYLAFYRCDQMGNGFLIGKRGDDEYHVCDDQDVLEFFYEHRDDTVRELVRAVCSNEKMWGEDLTRIGKFALEVERYLEKIYEVGMYAAIFELQ